MMNEHWMNDGWHWINERMNIEWMMNEHWINDVWTSGGNEDVVVVCLCKGSVVM